MSESKHVWVFLETEDGQLRSVGLELLGQGRLLADKMGEQLVGVILDPHAGTLAAQAIGCGADTVITMEDPALAHYNTDIFTAAMCRLVRKYAPEVLMIGATNVGRDLGPRISCRLHTGLTADCTHLDVDAHRCVLWTRPAFGGNLMATNICPDTKPQMGTVRPNVFRAPAFDPARTGAVFVESLPEDARRSSTELLELIPVLDAATANLTEAQIIVSGGRGLKRRKISRRCRSWPTPSAAAWAHPRRRSTPAGLSIRVGQTEDRLSRASTLPAAFRARSST